MSDFSHGGNPLHRGTLYLVSTTGDPEEPIMALKKLLAISNTSLLKLPLIESNKLEAIPPGKAA
jgi:hypothetical protein